MLSKLLPIVFLAAGTGAGVGAGLFLAPAHPPDGQTEHAKPEVEPETVDASRTEYIKLSNQFVVPIVQSERVSSLVVITLSLEAKTGMTEAIYAREPKLRDVFLRVLFDHANMGGFRGAFTQAENLDLLRTALRDVAQKEMGEDILNVLIMDIARQDT